MTLRNILMLGMALVGLALMSSLPAHAQLQAKFLTLGHKGYQVPGGGGLVFAAGGDPNAGAPYQLTNDFSFDIVAVSDSLSLFTNPSGTIIINPQPGGLLTQNGPVDIASGASLLGDLQFIATDGGFPNPIPDFQVEWTLDLHKKSDNTDLGNSEFIFDVSADPPSDSAPEAGSIALFAGGLIGVALWKLRRRK
ncbi:MAG TPA: hypothetical protein VKU00_24395 [Chthonomonadaceae bacterium]|nr:hypothetical protein [Chthonomonadaceae bacterium]